MRKGQTRRIVVGLLVMQLVIFGASLGPALWTVSVFCTAYTSSPLQLFGWIHVVFAGLFVFGLASLLWPRLRIPYAILLGVALSALPVQARLVQQGRLYCDAF
jgi:hypothetical protein